MEPHITILLASYNGERYISEQIESIVKQTYKDWTLIIQDDCSSDNTGVIAGKFAEQYKDRIQFFRRETPSGSARNNFFDMLKYVNSDYGMTCDQDDVWLPDKIENTMNCMHEMERTFGKNKPILVHSDLKVVDDQLKTLSNSLFKYQRLDAKRDKLNHLLVQNIVTGCTIMVNRPLIGKINGLPDRSIMHDWWMALIAAVFGHIGFVRKPTILYRQHCHNKVGAKNSNSFIYNVRRFLNWRQAESIMQDTYSQADQFLSIFRDQLTKEQRDLIYLYSSIRYYSKAKRLQIILMNNFWKYGFFRKCGQIFFG